MKNHPIAPAAIRTAPSRFTRLTAIAGAAIAILFLPGTTQAGFTSTGDNVLQPTNAWVGFTAEGSLVINEGYDYLRGFLTVGRYKDAIGIITVTGIGTSLSVSEILNMGYLGRAVLNLELGATMTTNKSVEIGVTGTGTLNIRSGAVLTSNGNSEIGTASQIFIGNSSTAGASSATVDGAGSQWIIPNLGISVSGVLTVSNGGNISTTGVGVTSTGALLVTGLDSVTGAAATLDLQRSFSIDNSGSDAAVVSAGGIVNARGNSFIGSYQGLQGTMTVTGAGSQVNVVGDMTIGASSGRGTLTVTDGALFSVSKTASALGTGDGTLTVGGRGSNSNPGTPIGVAVLHIGTGGAAGKLNVSEITGFTSTNPPVPPTDSTVVFNHNETAYQFTNTAGTGILINGGTKVRQEAGTTIFTAASGYQGGTLITGGRLVVNNASGSGTGSGAVNVSGTGVLGGRGTISGNITVASGGATLPGDSQILKVGSLKYEAGSAAKFTLATTGAGGEVPAAGMNCDRIQMTGNLVIDSGATLQLQLTASSLSYFHDHNGTDPLGNYFLFDLTAPITGKFDFLNLMLDGTTYTQSMLEGRATFAELGITLDVGYTGDAATNSLLGGNDMTIQVSSVPEPFTGCLLLAGVVGVVFTRRRKSLMAG
ncbi:hypothetical protein [Verrucomicrobium sp. BvORR034]|uniref:beta strand repeat-containing protein n=1 Tax=Verrucomicrobium sp. BvORR034 TaxID=1396418 RepID=UPI0006792598|nr:hypothetical protein [Verrucomicrobium sp. BvORR034]